MTIEIGLFALFLVLSGLFSGSETALTSLNEVKVRKLLAQRGRAAEPLRLWIERPGEFLSTILICNNLVNVGSSALATVVTYRMVGRSSEGLAVAIATGVTTILILMFGEVTPKNFAKIHHERIALLVVRPLLWLRIASSSSTR